MIFNYARASKILVNYSCQCYNNQVKYVGEGTIRLKSIDTEAKTAELEAVQETIVSGDANGDGKFNVADAVTLQKYLLCAEDCEAVSTESTDMNSDGVVDVFDMIFLRKQLIIK